MHNQPRRNKYKNVPRNRNSRTKHAPPTNHSPRISRHSELYPLPKLARLQETSRYRSRALRSEGFWPPTPVGNVTTINPDQKAKQPIHYPVAFWICKKSSSKNLASYRVRDHRAGKICTPYHLLITIAPIAWQSDQWSVGWRWCKNISSIPLCKKLGELGEIGRNPRRGKGYRLP